MAKHYPMWNTFPGSLHLHSAFSRSLKDYPFYYQTIGQTVPSKFTAVIYVTSVKESSSIHRLIRTVARSAFAAKVLFYTIFLAKKGDYAITRPF